MVPIRSSWVLVVPAVGSPTMEPMVLIRIFRIHHLWIWFVLQAAAAVPGRSCLPGEMDSQEVQAAARQGDKREAWPVQAQHRRGTTVAASEQIEVRAEGEERGGLG